MIYICCHLSLSETTSIKLSVVKYARGLWGLQGVYRLSSVDAVFEQFARKTPTGWPPPPPTTPQPEGRDPLSPYNLNWQKEQPSLYSSFLTQPRWHRVFHNNISVYFQFFLFFLLLFFCVFFVYFFHGQKCLPVYSRSSNPWIDWFNSMFIWV